MVCVCVFMSEKHVRSESGDDLLDDDDDDNNHFIINHQSSSSPSEVRDDTI